MSDGDDALHVLPPESRGDIIPYIRRIAASQEYREIGDTVTRAATLVKNGVGSAHHVGIALKVERSALRRAVEALNAARDVGVVGRPQALTRTAREELKKWVVEQDAANKFPTADEISAKVLPTPPRKRSRSTGAADHMAHNAAKSAPLLFFVSVGGWLCGA